MTVTVEGNVYAASDHHHAVYIERTDGTGRMIVLPEVWDTAKAYQWVDDRTKISATGILAAGLPEIMRATITEV